MLKVSNSKILYILLFAIINIYAVEFKVATYNVENFFDLHYDRTEYKEYRPHTKLWNKYSFKKKLANITKVIKDLDADIIALQEIESKKALYILNTKLHYKYSYFLKNRASAVGLAILSRYKIVENKKIKIKTFDTYSRPILRSTIMIDGKKLIVYVAHFRSKRAAESKRIPYGLALKNDIDNLDNEDYLILGDLNSNYDEYITFKYNRKLNNTFGVTAINQILNTTVGKNFVTRENIFSFDDKVHYNLWLELPKKDRYSVLFKKEKSTPDNIIISKTLLDGKNISYIIHSFNTFKPKYLIKNHYINRWNLKKAKGYSDHLPIYAMFTTKGVNSIAKIKSNKKKTTIDDLYELNYIQNPIFLKNCIVIYSSKPYTIIKQKSSKAILIYNKALDVKLGDIYDITVGSIDSYNGLKEIKDIADIHKSGYYKNYKNLYKDGTKIDLFDIQNQNEIITNLKGIYKKRYLYLESKKRIKLFFDKKIFKDIKLKNGTKIYIKSAHLGVYRSKTQLNIHKLSDIK